MLLPFFNFNMVFQIGLNNKIFVITVKQIIYLILIILILNNCKSNTQRSDEYESDILKIEKIKDNVFKHISYLETDNYGKVPCNGMVFISKNEAVVFDTPTNNEASKALIDWLGNRKIKAVIVTHFHIDCLGGLEQFHLNGINSYSNELTIELAKKDNRVLPQKGFNNKLEINVGGTKVFAEFYGEGHTKDNIVGYIPRESTLFGGCLIKALDANKGNLNDANTKEWSKL